MGGKRPYNIISVGVNTYCHLERDIANIVMDPQNLDLNYERQIKVGNSLRSNLLIGNEGP